MNKYSDNTSIKIPAKHYLGLQKRGTDSLPLGFLTPWGTDSAARKRMATVDSWAKGGLYGIHSKKPNTLTPKVLDNIPMAGFKLSDTIRRTSNWGRGNVVWRIDDPRGFELEISNTNLMQIMLCAIIIGGEIMCTCVWGREGSDNVLIPTESKLYKNAMQNTERQKKKVSVSDLKIGNTIVLQNGTEGVYLGSFFDMLYAESSYDDEQKVITPATIQFSQKEKHYILTKYPNKNWRSNNNTNEIIICVSSLKVAEIKDASVSDRATSQIYINTTRINKNIDVVDGNWGKIYNFMGVSTTRDAEVKLILSSIDNIDEYAKQFVTVLGHLVIATCKTGTFLTYASSISNRSRYKSVEIAELDQEKLENFGIIQSIFVQRQGSHWASTYRYMTKKSTTLSAVIDDETTTWRSVSYQFTDKNTNNKMMLLPK